MRIYLLLILLFINAAQCWADGTLSPNWRFESKSLGYTLHYRVYLPEVVDENVELPTLYVVDGQWFIKNGDIIKVIEQEIDSGNIKPIIVVFVDSRDPDHLNINRRNKEFMCNPNYLKFFINELLPTVEHSFPAISNRNNRVIAGLSFGGLNAACFGLAASNVFGGIAMLSPANDKHLKAMNKSYQQIEMEKLAVFISGGTRNDNLSAIRNFKKTLVDKGHHVEFQVVRYGHNWKNWQPLLDDLLLTFFKKN
jgi:enterochelin esterase-like enzyme